MESTQKNVWYFAYENQWYGPASKEELTMLMYQKKIDEDTLVWKEGMKEGQALKKTTLYLHCPSHKEDRPVRSNRISQRMAVMGLCVSVVFGLGFIGYQQHQNHLEQERIAAVKAEKKKEQEIKEKAWVVKTVAKKEIKDNLTKTMEDYREEVNKTKTEQEAQDTSSTPIQQPTQQTVQTLSASLPAPQPQPQAPAPEPSIQPNTTHDFEMKISNHYTEDGVEYWEYTLE